MLKKLLSKKVCIPLLLGLMLVLAFSQLAFAADEDSDWAAMYEAEWRAMGLDAAPALMPPSSSNTPSSPPPQRMSPIPRPSSLC